VIEQTRRLHPEVEWPSNDEQGERWSSLALQASLHPDGAPQQISEKSE